MRMSGTGGAGGVGRAPCHSASAGPKVATCPPLTGWLTRVEGGKFLVVAQRWCLDFEGAGLRVNDPLHAHMINTKKRVPLLAESESGRMAVQSAHPSLTRQCRYHICSHPTAAPHRNVAAAVRISHRQVLVVIAAVLLRGQHVHGRVGVEAGGVAQQGLPDDQAVGTRLLEGGWREGCGVTERRAAVGSDAVSCPQPAC